MSKIPRTLFPDFRLKWCDTNQNMFSNFCYQTKNRGPYVFLFVSSPWRNPYLKSTNEASQFLRKCFHPYNMGTHGKLRSRLAQK